MRYDAEHKERTRRRLLTEAAEALRSEGPERVGVAALRFDLPAGSSEMAAFTSLGPGRDQ